VLVEAGYICAFCGEEIVIQVDLSAGAQQEFVEDCPVCCRPHVLRVEVARDNTISLSSQAE